MNFIDPDQAPAELHDDELVAMTGGALADPASYGMTIASYGEHGGQITYPFA